MDEQLGARLVVLVARAEQPQQVVRRFREAAVELVVGAQRLFAIRLDEVAPEKLRILRDGVEDALAQRLLRRRGEIGKDVPPVQHLAAFENLEEVAAVVDQPEFVRVGGEFRLEDDWQVDEERHLPHCFAQPDQQFDVGPGRGQEQVLIRERAVFHARAGAVIENAGEIAGKLALAPRHEIREGFDHMDTLAVVHDAVESGEALAGALIAPDLSHCFARAKLIAGQKHGREVGAAVFSRPQLLHSRRHLVEELQRTGFDHAFFPLPVEAHPDDRAQRVFVMRGQHGFDRELRTEFVAAHAQEIGRDHDPQLGLGLQSLLQRADEHKGAQVVVAAQDHGGFEAGRRKRRQVHLPREILVEVEGLAGEIQLDR